MYNNYNYSLLRTLYVVEINIQQFMQAEPIAYANRALTKSEKQYVLPNVSVLHWYMHLNNFVIIL